MENNIPNEELDLQKALRPTQFGVSAIQYHVHNGTDSPQVAASDVSQAVRYVYLSDCQNQLAAGSYAVSHTIFVNPSVTNTYKVRAVSAVFGSASSSGTVNVEVTNGTQAITAGAAQLTSAIPLSAGTNVVVTGTVVGVPTPISGGSRVNLIFGGTVAGLGNCCVTVTLQPLT